jgi:hypothetical protein
MVVDREQRGEIRATPEWLSSGYHQKGDFPGGNRKVTCLEGTERSETE